MANQQRVGAGLCPLILVFLAGCGAGGGTPPSPPLITWFHAKALHGLALCHRRGSDSPDHLDATPERILRHCDPEREWVTPRRQRFVYAESFTDRSDF